MILNTNYISNYDGDTTRVSFQLPFDIIVTKNIRLLGLDTPELSPKKSKTYPDKFLTSRINEKEKAIFYKNFLKELIDNNTSSNVQTKIPFHLYTYLETVSKRPEEVKVGYYKRPLAILYKCEEQISAPYTLEKLKFCINVNDVISKKLSEE